MTLIDSLNERLEVLTREASEASARRQQAKEFGDLRENTEFTVASDELEAIYGEMARIRQQITEYQESTFAGYQYSGYISIGSNVKLQYPGGKVRSITIVHPSQSKPSDGLISCESPVGLALEGRSVGESITIITAQKESVYTILEVS